MRTMSKQREIIRVSKEEFIKWIDDKYGGKEKYEKAYNEIFIYNLQAPFMDNLSEAVEKTDKIFAELYVKDKFKDMKIIDLIYALINEIDGRTWIEIGLIVEVE